uniref:carbohydrate sulfotransferase 9-like isoform X2 n=1 Tax=Styela clava TaxID=7725 RepID=UPI001939DF1F|nr:carbohydrate sulfotransferase 9-like isoform X2 [Styela clava]
MHLKYKAALIIFGALFCFHWSFKRKSAAEEVRLDEEFYYEYQRISRSELSYLPGANLSKERKSHLRQFCYKLGYEYSESSLDVMTWLKKPISSRPRLYFSDKLKVIVCGVPKCGSTEWRKALLIAEGDVNTTLPSDIDHEYAFTLARKRRFFWERFQGRTKHSRDMMNKRLNNYYRIMTVRDPLERVVSAYVDKMLPGGSGGTIYEKISRDIHHKFGHRDNKTDTRVHKWKFKYKEYLRKLPVKKLHALYEFYWEQYKLFNYPPPPFVEV